MVSDNNYKTLTVGLDVLILVLMEDGLGLTKSDVHYCAEVLILVLMEDGLGPLNNGTSLPAVLILVLMEDGLGLGGFSPTPSRCRVLILVLMEDGLGRTVGSSRNEN